MAVVTLDIQDNIAVVKINNPPVNAMSHAVRAELHDIWTTLEQNTDIAIALLLCDGKSFISGADIKEFSRPPVSPTLPNLIGCIEKSRIPWVAAIHGHALGGGLELALACHYRVCAEETKLGFPEVNLGLIPGSGGTVRTPRLIATEHALDLIITGKPVSGSRAMELGLIDSVFTGDVLSNGISFAAEKMHKPQPMPLLLRPVLEVPSEAYWHEKESAIKRKSRGNTTPLEAMEAVRSSVTLPATDALTAERKRFLRLAESTQSKALRYAFFAERAAGKIPELQHTDTRPIETIGVIGGGLMGSGIATTALLAGLPVTMVEQNQSALDRGLNTVHQNLTSSAKRGILNQQQFDQAMTRLTGGVEYTACRNVDLVIEAVFEDMATKQDVFRSLQDVVSDNTILATNTSYLDVNEIASVVTNSERVIGLHFFSPAHIMKLLEVVKTDSVADTTLASVLKFARKIGKTAVVSGVCEGFIGNRIMARYRRDIEFMVEEGASPYDVDKAMKAFGMPMGLFEMQDMAGLDISYAMRRSHDVDRDPSAPYCALGDKLVETGNLGRKTGKGWYDYETTTALPNTEVHRLIQQEQTRKNITPRSFSPDHIIDRFLGVMNDEGKQILSEGIARSAEAIDVVMVHGFGFPRWKGGPMFWAAHNTIQDLS